MLCFDSSINQSMLFVKILHTDSCSLSDEYSFLVMMGGPVYTLMGGPVMGGSVYTEKEVI